MDRCNCMQNTSGIPDTDLIIYVTYQQTGSCYEKTLAWAYPCFQDQFGRPIAGTVNICPYIFEDEHYWKEDVVVLIHEITHIVIMAPPLWNDFRDSNGDKIPHSNVLSEKQSDDLYYITSPNVAQFARSHFNCNTLIGFPLENTGNGGSAGAHWDERYGMSLLMGSTIWGSLQYFSNLSMALMADSGWYSVDFSYAEPFHWGKNEGCAFFEEACINTRKSSNFPQYFCDSNDDHGCFYKFSDNIVSELRMKQKLCTQSFDDDNYSVTMLLRTVNTTKEEMIYRSKLDILLTARMGDQQQRITVHLEIRSAIIMILSLRAGM